LQFAAVCGSGSDFLKETPEDFINLIKERNAWQAKNPNAKSNEVQKVIEDLKRKYQPDYDKIYKYNIDERKTNGDADEEGLLKFFEKIEDIRSIRNIFPQHFQDGEEIKVPFTSENKISGFLRKINKDLVPECFKDVAEGEFIVAFKGAPENLIKHCKYYLMNGKKIPVDEFFMSRFTNACESMQLQGLRTLAFAFNVLDNKIYDKNYVFKNDTHKVQVPISERIPNYPVDNLVMIGLIVSEDPPR
jgi:magnesium-transporting ATPase (P-type)